MLQCPRCSNPLTVTHPHDHHDSPPAIIQYPVYQNCTTHSPQQQLQDVRDQERNMLVELQSLQIKVLENQLQQVRLGHELMQAQLLPREPRSPETVPLPRATPEVDTETILLNSRLQLEQCGWYYGRLSWQQSEQLLRNTSPGTFFVRDSQDSRFLYSLSLQREKEEGPTSVRIAFARGKFSLDADDSIRHLMPRFDSIGSLVSHYVELDSSQDNSQGKLFLQTPLYKAPPTLAHCARLQINKSLQQSHKFSIESSRKPMMIPAKLLEYLNKYPLSI